MLYSSTYNSKLGQLSIVCDDNSVHGVWFKNQKYFQASLTETPIANENNQYSLLVNDWLNRYFDHKKPSINELNLSPDVSDFRKKVLIALQAIPYGETISYKQIGESISDSSMSAQAIGGAVSHNPISIIIPCHRVVGTKGSLTGYAAGIETKISLLTLEHANLNNLFIPK